MATATAPTTPEQELAWEAEKRPLATGASAAAAVLILAAPLFLLTVVQRDFPSIGPVQALAPALRGQAEAVVDPRTSQIHFLNDHAAGIIGYAIANLLGAAALSVALYYLFRATRARRPELPAAFKWLVVLGPGIAAVALLISEIVTLSRASSFPKHCVAGAACGHDAANHVFEKLLLPGSIGTLGTLATAFAIVITALNAMRCGLLTRFMGVLGIIVGVLFVLPITGGLPIVQAFWIGALAPLFAMRWPQGQPPAWHTGVAEPWPSAQDLRAERDAERNHAEAQAIKAAPADSAGEAADPVAPAKPAHPASKKRRKRRR